MAHGAVHWRSGWASTKLPAGAALLPPADGKLSIGAAQAAAHNQLRSDGAFSAGGNHCAALGVISEIERMLDAQRIASARTDDSRPGPGPLISTSRFLMPHAPGQHDRPPRTATWAAKGVDLREPLKAWHHPTSCPGEQGIALTVGDGDDGVVERGVHVRDAVRRHSCELFLRTRRAAVFAGAFAMSCLDQGRSMGLTSSARQRPCADPCGCGHWCACVGHASASHGDGAGRGSSPSPSAA